MVRLGVPVGGWVKKLRAVEDQSAPIPEEKTSELGELICSHSLRRCLGKARLGSKSLSWQTRGGWVKYPPGLGG